MPVLAMGVERRHHRNGGLPQREPRHERHERFVQVEDVEPRGPEQRSHAPPRSRIDADAGFGAADDQRHTGAQRQLAVAEGCRRRAEHRHVVSEPAERAGLRADVRVDSPIPAQIVRRADTDAQRKHVLSECLVSSVLSQWIVA
jgi:hypothetical protein